MGSRQPLSRSRILAAAVSFADAHGVDALTMRKIADILEFRVMSLYNHVANKQEMLSGMLDVVVGEIDPPPTTGSWKDVMQASAAAAHDVLSRHPWAASEWSKHLPGPHRLRYIESILQILTEADLGAEIVYRGYHAVTMHIVGFTVQEVGFEQALSADLDEMANAFLEEMGSEFPYMAEHVRGHLDDHDHGDEFGFVLGLILDGLDRAAREPASN